MTEKIVEAELTTKMSIREATIQRLEKLGVIPTEEAAHRDTHVGSSNYSKKLIQPWAIWKEYNLNPWDADIVKRILLTKQIPNTNIMDARIEDYEKIKHICDERIFQLKNSEENNA